MTQHQTQETSQEAGKQHISATIWVCPDRLEIILLSPTFVPTVRRVASRICVDALYNISPPLIAVDVDHMTPERWQQYHPEVGKGIEDAADIRVKEKQGYRYTPHPWKQPHWRKKEAIRCCRPLCKKVRKRCPSSPHMWFLVGCISPFMRLAGNLTALVHAIPAWSVQTRRAPSRHSRDARD